MEARSVAGIGFERELWALGYRAVAGVDEAGRGALAGPVVAAAVILPPDEGLLQPLLGRVNDSKQLTALQRDRHYDLVCRHALAYAVGRTECDVIDAGGIVPATKEAMLQAIAGLAARPDYVLIDFVTLPGRLACPHRGLVHGDSLSLSIAAASIIAKVTRDRWMCEQEALYPGYGFAQHKGYGTDLHHASLARLGPCTLHRRSFAPLLELAGDHA